jgi:hypothetical protein
MASAVTYARQQRFFKKGVLIQAPGGHDALTMYAGALMWLACFVFAIAACSWTVFGVNDYLQKLGDSFGWLRVQARKHRDQCRRLLSACSFAAQSLRSLEGNLTVLCRYPFKNRDSVIEVVNQFAAGGSGGSGDDARFYEDGRSPARDHQYQAQGRDLPRLSLEFSTFRDHAAEGHVAATAAKATEGIHLSGLRGELNQARSQLRSLEKQNWLAMASKWRHPIRAAQNVFANNPPPQTSTDSLETKIAEKKLNILAIAQKCEASSVRLNGWNGSISEWSWALRKWQDLIEKREKERSRADSETRRLRTLTRWTFFGMTGCWIAQWVWWVGYIRLLGDA